MTTISHKYDDFIIQKWTAFQCNGPQIDEFSINSKIDAHLPTHFKRLFTKCVSQSNFFMIFL